MAKRDESSSRDVIVAAIRRDEAFLGAMVEYGVPVETMARMLGCTRQTVYRKMQEARIRMRRAQAAIAAARGEEE